MKVYVLFGQRVQRYPGQYGLEALACMTEHDQEENHEYLPIELEKARAGREFESLAIVALDVREGEIRKILSPEPVVQAEVSKR